MPLSQDEKKRILKKMTLKQEEKIAKIIKREMKEFKEETFAKEHDALIEKLFRKFDEIGNIS